MLGSSSATILGAIAGDVIGSAYEFHNVRSTTFALFSKYSKFTDDTVLTIAVADAILNNFDFAPAIHAYGNHYPHRGYGGNFSKWLKSHNPLPYGSFGNGSAMRVSPVGFACISEEDVLNLSKQTAEVTHNHFEGIKGAQAIAMSVFMAKNGKNKDEIRDYVSNKFNYNLNFTLDAIRPFYSFDETCQGSVPQAIMAFLDSNDYEHCIRLAVSVGGDSDTIACMAGGIASAFYKKIPDNIISEINKYLPDEFINTIEKFDKLYGI